MATFKEAVEKVLVHEGGYVFHKADKGGPTNLGITQRVYDEWMRKRTGNPNYKSTLEEMQKLPRGNAILIYKENYWDKIRGDEIKDYAVAFVIFDAAVNSGNAQAVRTAQRILQINPDGVAGKEYIKHLNAYDPKKFVEQYLAARKKFYADIIAKNPSQKVFEKGWFRRVSDNLEYVSKWVGTPVGKATVGIGGLLLLGTIGFFLFRFFKKK
jgi:lysozyme family protein